MYSGIYIFLGPYGRFVRAFARKNDTLKNGECLKNVPSLRFKPDLMDMNAMFFSVDSTMIRTNTLSKNIAFVTFILGNNEKGKLP
jgi:hypothetical protein